MNKKNKVLTMLILGSGAAASIAFINKYIKVTATSKNILEDSKSLCYKWRLGNIHYTKTGSGKPLLLIHDLTSISSGYEWSSLIPALSEHFTVYTIDLLGCGRSEKPNMTYTNYLYVQLITDFIKSVIGRRTDIVASGSSAAIPLMACSSDNELFDRLLFINPDSLLTCSQVPGKSAKLYKFILDLPIIGTFIYHISTGKQALRELFTGSYFSNPFSVKQQMVDAYYESAHLGESPKSVFASAACHYTKCNITNALKKIDNSIYILGNEALDGMEERLEEFQKYNPAIETTLLQEGRYLPQLECPHEVLKAIEMYLY
ncbi:MAG: alpha/beta fold hydrolase [Lachnospiraceae bacterium]|nr:alpha/beta fold hydrolase [Lachnospiraceae bacterium]